MATYKELKAKIDALAIEAEAARQAELQTIVDEVRNKIAEYGLTQEDLFGVRRNRSRQKATAAVGAKYRDPKTGATWSGRGRAPAWIKDAKNRNRFLIQE